MGPRFSEPLLIENDPPMPKQPVATLDAYAEVVRKSKLVDPQQLNRILKALRAEHSEEELTPKRLAKQLLRQGLITPWQNSHLKNGRTKGFFLGKYKLLSYLGSGGMSTVYLAEHTMMRRQVAIKVLMESEVGKITLERFRRECRAVASLDHPNIVAAHDFDADGQFHYLVMEYVEGHDLDTLVEKEGPLPFRVAADYIRQAATGLAHAHENGMVHRDIKPANLLVNKEGVVKLLDLGVAKISNANQIKLTVENQQNLVGTVDFLAPEQALNSHEVDERADIYSLGCTFYYLLTGKPPFAEGTQAQRLLAHQVQHPTSIVQYRADAPQGLIDICMKMLAKKPEQRYQSCAETAQVLRDWMATAEEGPTENVIEASQRPTSHSDTRDNAHRHTIAVVQAMVRITCPNCESAFGAPKQEQARKIKCPHCGTVITIQGESSKH